MKSFISKFATSLLGDNMMYSILVLVMTIIISFMSGMLIQKRFVDDEITKGKNNNGDKVMIFK